MKTKHKFYNEKIFFDDKWKNLLEEEAKKGWILKKFSQRFSQLELIFKKEEPQDIKYQIDFSTPIPEYQNLLNEQGYELVDYEKNLYIYKNININADDLQTDETTKINALIRFFSIHHPLFLLFENICALLFIYFLRYLITNLVSFSDALFSFNYIIGYFTFIALYITQFIDIIKRRVIVNQWKRILNDEQPKFQFYKILDKIIYIMMRICCVLICLLIITIIIYAPLNLLIVLIISGLCEVMFYIIYKVILHFRSLNYPYSFHHIIAVSLALLILNQIPNSLWMKQKPYMNNQNIDIRQTTTLFYKENLFSDNFDNQYEYLYTCLTDRIAEEVFKNEIIKSERNSRMDEDMKKMILEKGEWSSDETPYYTYDQAIKNMETYPSTLVDRCYFRQHYAICIKNKTVLSFYYENSIEDVLNHYFE